MTRDTEQAELASRPRAAISKRTLAIAALSLAGVGVSAYLTYEHYAGGSYFCAGLGDCDYVNSSPYATLAGAPVAALGLATYLGMLVAALAVLWDGRYSYVGLLAIFGFSLVGVLFSAYLSYVELFILHAV